MGEVFREGAGMPVSGRESSDWRYGGGSRSCHFFYIARRRGALILYLSQLASCALFGVLV